MGRPRLLSFGTAHKKWLVRQPDSYVLHHFPEDKISPSVLPKDFEPTARGLFQRFLRALYCRQRDHAEIALTAGIQSSTYGSREYIWFLIGKAMLRLEQGYIEAPPEIDVVLAEFEGGKVFPKDELDILVALRGYNRDVELAIRGLEEPILDAKQLELKDRTSDYLRMVQRLYNRFSESACTEVQAFFRIVYHRHLVRDYPMPKSTNMAALPYEMAMAEPRQYLDFCDDLLKEGRLDLFLYNVRFRGRSVSEIGPAPFQQRLQQCMNSAISRNQIALSRYLMVRNTELLSSDPKDGVNRRYPEYEACIPIFLSSNNLVDAASCRLYLLATKPESEKLATATEIRQELLVAGYMGLAFECLLDHEVPLCLKSDPKQQVACLSDLIGRLVALANVERFVTGPRNFYQKVYDNLLHWMSQSTNIYTMTVLIEFMEMLWAQTEPALYQAVTMSEKVCAGRILIARTLAGRFPSQNMVKKCADSAWRYMRYARVWDDDHIFSEAMSASLNWRVAMLSFCESNEEMLPQLEEVEELVALGFEKDRDQMRFLEAIEKCCIGVRAAMLHPERPRELEEVEFYQAGRLLEQRAEIGQRLLDTVAKEWTYADHGERLKPLSIEARAMNLRPTELQKWKIKRLQEVELNSFTQLVKENLAKAL